METAPLSHVFAFENGSSLMLLSGIVRVSYCILQTLTRLEIVQQLTDCGDRCRLKLEALQREQDMQRRLDEAVVEAQQAAARARALTEEREALRNLLKALRTDQARGRG